MLAYQELLRLYDSLNISGGRSDASFQERFDAVERVTVAPLSQRYNAATTAAEKANVLRDFESRMSGAVVKTGIANEVAERKSLYLMLKENKSGGGNTFPPPSPTYPGSGAGGQVMSNDALFEFFGLKEKKKRKQRLVDAVWMELSSAPHLDLSAQVVMKITSLTSEYKLEWVKSIKRQRMQRDCLETVRACILSIQRQHDRQAAAAAVAADMSISTLRRGRRGKTRRPTAVGFAAGSLSSGLVATRR